MAQGGYIHPHGNQSGSYLRQRARNFGVTMLVMGISFILYYLGFFGGVAGPMSGQSIGAWLAAQHITRNDLFLISVILTWAALSWNWAWNLALRLGGILGLERRPPVAKGVWGHCLWMVMAIWTLTLWAHL